VKINVKTKGVIITSKQKAQLEKQILKLKKYLKDVSPVTVDVMLMDESGPDKGGVDQAVHINAVLPKQTIFIEETDNRIMRAFTTAYKRFERKLKQLHEAKVDGNTRAGRFTGIIDAFGRVIPRRKRNKNK